MRNYYVVYELLTGNKVSIDKKVLNEAFVATCTKRKTTFSTEQIERTLGEISVDEGLLNLWELYKNDNFYVGNIEWNTVCKVVLQMVPCDGQCCGAKRPRCGAERPPFSLI